MNLTLCSCTQICWGGNLRSDPVHLGRMRDVYLRNKKNTSVWEGLGFPEGFGATLTWATWSPMNLILIWRFTLLWKEGWTRWPPFWFEVPSETTKPTCSYRVPWLGSFVGEEQSGAAEDTKLKLKLCVSGRAWLGDHSFKKINPRF